MAYPNTTVNVNYSNRTAGNPDNKDAPTNAPGTTRPESQGEAINTALRTSDVQSAIDAERRWLAEVSGHSQIPDARKSNRIRLVSTTVATNDNFINTGTEQVTFNLSPEISETKQVIYAEIGDIRQAASILIYGGSPSRKWSVNAKFLSRTAEEANNTWKSIQLMRSWTNPDTNYKYGLDSGTPHVLRFYGYGRTWQGIPVVLSSLNVDFPTDIDYIPTDYGTNVPVIQSVSFQLTEARTPDDLLVKFDLEKFKLGVLPQW